MRNLQLSLKADRRDRAARPETSLCPACGNTAVAPMARTTDSMYFGCDGCWHVWSVSKPGREHISQSTMVFTRDD